MHDAVLADLTDPTVILEMAGTISRADRLKRKFLIHRKSCRDMAALSATDLLVIRCENEFCRRLSVNMPLVKRVSVRTHEVTCIVAKLRRAINWFPPNRQPLRSPREIPIIYRLAKMMREGSWTN